MAEFCWDCWRQINETTESKDRYSMSRELELCEHCGQYKHVVVKERFWSRMQKVLVSIKNRKHRK